MSKIGYISKDEFMTMLSNLNFEYVEDYYINFIKEFENTGDLMKKGEPISYSIRYNDG